jgi:SAM-dependent methyltransferase
VRLSEGDDIQKDLLCLNHIARDRGWDNAVDEVYGAGSDIQRYISDKDRLKWVDLLNVSPEGRVLEIGPGLGQGTVLLAERFSEVFVLEVVPSQADFVAQRMRQSGIGNVEVACGGDACRLPYKNESFDAIAINLVFEWCGVRDKRDTPASLQARLLREVFRVLKPGGKMFLSTKNRFSLGYLLGGRDEHYSDMPFGSALPRWMARGLEYLSGRTQSRALLHSYSGLKGMIEAAGLTHLSPFWAIPDARFPKCFLKMDGVENLSDVTEKFGNLFPRRVRWVLGCIPEKWIKYFTAGLVFIARKGTTSEMEVEVCQ